MTYLQMLRLKYGILNEADDDEEDENKKNQNNEEEEEEDEPDTPDDGGGEEQTEEEPTEEEEEDEPDTPADTPDDGTEQQDTTEPETTGEEEEDEPDTPEGGDENLPAEQNDDVETGETDEDEPDVPDTGEENPEGGETTDDGGDMGDEEDEPDVPEGGEPAGDDGMGDTEGDMDDGMGDTGEEGGGEEGETTDDGGEKSELQQAEEPLYQDLSDEQKNIRDKELKNNFVELNETLTTILERMNKVVKDTINIKIVDFVVNNLLKLKDMVCYYLTETFNTKSYQENMLFYQQCLVVMSSIQKLIPEITFEEEDTESK